MNDVHIEKKVRIRPRWWWIVVGAVVAGGGGFLAIGTGHGNESEKKSTDDGILAVNLVQPKVQSFRREIYQPGIVQSYEQTPIYSKLAGFVQIPDDKIDIGYMVKKDQLLCKIWVPEIEQAVHVKEARVIQGTADVTQTEHAFNAAVAYVTTCEENVKVAKASVGRAKASLKRWEGDYIRFSELYKAGGLRKETVDEADKQRIAAGAFLQEEEALVVNMDAALVESKARRDQAQVEVDLAKANLAVYKAQLREENAWFSYANITAPFDGIITRRFTHDGHFVQPSNSGTTSTSSEPLFVIMRTDIMRVVVQVPEYDAPLVKDGADSIVKLQAYPGQDIKCRVTQSSWSLDHDVRTLRVELFLQNSPDRKYNVSELSQAASISRDRIVTPVGKQLRPGDTVQPGMYANVSIFADVPNATTLPAKAVLNDGYQKYCYMFEDGRAKRVNVHAGITNNQLTEVLEKQAPPTKLGEPGKWVKFTGNDEVITSGLKSIQDGQVVKKKTSEEAGK